MAPAFWAAGLGVALMATVPAMAEEAPKYGGILTYMIPADAPPSFDAHREGTSGEEWQPMVLSNASKSK